VLLSRPSRPTPSAEPPSDEGRWQSMSADQFTRLRRGQCLRERWGRVWTVYAEPFGPQGLVQVVIHAGHLARLVNERFADDYMLLPEPR
jgi:hypothetical protein